MRLPVCHVQGLREPQPDPPVDLRPLQEEGARPEGLPVAHAPPQARRPGRGQEGGGGEGAL